MFFYVLSPAENIVVQHAVDQLAGCFGVSNIVIKYSFALFKCECSPQP